MTHVSAIFSEEDLIKEMDEGWVRVQSNDTNTLFIYNYTEKAQFAKHWNPVTLNCRGLILDEYGSIVARPWKKFFNYGEGRLAIDDVMPVQVTDKMDGSLGILYPQDLSVDYLGFIATRGSFQSDQAVHATEIWRKRYEMHVNFQAMFEYTFLFEIIYPKNRIVLDYGDMDDLVLLGAVHIERGYYLGPQEAAGVLNWTGPQTETFEYKNMAEAFAAPMRPNAEGLVVRSGSEMVKIKQVDYVELHRIVTNLSERTVWARMSAGETLQSLVDVVPDEWHGFLRDTYRTLSDRFLARQDEILDEYTMKMPLDVDRKAFAMVASKSPNKAYMFALLDGKPIDQMIWAEIKPSIDKE